MKQLLKLLLILSFFSITFISCSSNQSEESGDVTAAEGLEEGDEFADDFGDEFDAELDGELDAGGSDELGSDDFGSDEFAEDDFGSEDEFAIDDGEDDFFDDDFSEDVGDSGDAMADTGTMDDGGDDFFAEDSTSDSFADSGSLEEEAPLVEDSGTAMEDSGDSFADDSFADSSASFDDSFTEVDSGFSDSSMADSSYEEVQEEPVRKWIPVKKMATTPFNKGGQLLNTIYIIRDGDTLESVSQKIYGSDRTADILAANPHLNRSFSVGDKIYYNSPNRPNDSNQIITYYEDVGAQPQTYVSQDGDNIRAVAQSLLGHPESWKEVWATNMNVESKGVIPGGLELRYYPEGMPAPSQAVASNDMPPPPEMEEPAMAEPEMADIPPPPPAPDMEEPQVAAGTVQPPVVEPPPPPPPPAVAPPPPPPPPQQAKVTKKGMGGLSNMKVIALGIVLICGSLLFFIWKRKQNRSSINMGETQI